MGVLTVGPSQEQQLFLQFGVIDVQLFFLFFWLDWFLGRRVRREGRRVQLEADGVVEESVWQGIVQLYLGIHDNKYYQIVLMNIEAAENCLQKGVNHLQRQEVEAALKWLRKSHSLNPTPQAEQLIALALKRQPSSSSSSQPSVPRKAPSPPRPAAPSFSKEQKDLVDRVSRLKDYYQILGVAKDAKEDDFKRAYRKLAIKLHPDKNQAPGSQEAFKLIAKAYDCLSNQEKRAHYDRFGEESPQRRGPSQYQPQEEMFNPEDIFQAFFNGGFEGGHVYFNGQRVRRPQRQAPQQRQANQFNLGAFLPLLFLFFTVVSNLSSSFGNTRLQDRLYSLNQSYSFPKRHLTQLDQPFYAQNNFHQMYPLSSSERRQIHEEVNRAWRQHWGEQCQQQSQNKHYLERYAAMSRGAQRVHYEEKAAALDLSSCDSYQRLRSTMA